MPIFITLFRGALEAPAVTMVLGARNIGSFFNLE